MITVTLTTDWGTDGIYSGAFKGRLVSRVPGVQLIDISHQIDPLFPPKAVFALQNAYQYFMKKTIHVIAVGGSMNSDYTSNQFICFEYNHHYFIGPNNGIWEMMFGELPSEVFLLEPTNLIDKCMSFPELDIYIEAIGKLAMGMQPKHLGESVECNLGRRISMPGRNKDSLVGDFLFFDVYGNGISNITQVEFLEVQNGRPFTIVVGMDRPQYTAESLSSTYFDGDSSKIIALFNFAGYLEIAVPNFRLDKFIHIDKNTKILVQFYNSEEEKNKELGLQL